MNTPFPCDPSPPIIDPAEEDPVSPMWPNGRCEVCGNGLSETGTCQNEDCQEYGDAS